MIPLLSILTPAVPSRIVQTDGLCKKLAHQIGALPVEHLVFIDNKRRTVGEKRDALLRMARGTYVAFVDDDDDVSDNYVDSLLSSINYASTPKPDVITFLQQATVNGATAIIEFGLGNPNDPFIGNKASSFTGGTASCRPIDKPETSDAVPPVKRNAWHVCAWKRELAIQSHFPPINYGEDWAYAAPLCAMAKTEVHIPKILHYYRHDARTTEAPPGQ